MQAMTLVTALNAAKNNGNSPSIPQGVPSRAPRVKRVTKINWGKSKGKPNTVPKAPLPD